MSAKSESFETSRRILELAVARDTLTQKSLDTILDMDAIRVTSQSLGNCFRQPTSICSGRLRTQQGFFLVIKYSNWLGRGHRGLFIAVIKSHLVETLHSR